MNGTHNLKRIIAGALLSGGIAVAGLGLAAGTAQPSPGSRRWPPGAQGNPCRGTPQWCGT
jgi:hypothetical protein